MWGAMAFIVKGYISNCTPPLESGLAEGKAGEESVGGPLVVAQTLSVNGGPVAFSWNKEQSDAARNSKDRAVIEHSSVTDVVPQQTGDNACDQFPEAPRRRCTSRRHWRAGVLARNPKRSVGKALAKASCTVVVPRVSAEVRATD
jgi:hypothetical protein